MSVIARRRSAARRSPNEHYAGVSLTKVAETRPSAVSFTCLEISYGIQFCFAEILDQVLLGSAARNWKRWGTFPGRWRPEPLAATTRPSVAQLFL